MKNFTLIYNHATGTKLETFFFFILVVVKDLVSVDEQVSVEDALCARLGHYGRTTNFL